MIAPRRQALRTSPEQGGCGAATQCRCPGPILLSLNPCSQAELLFGKLGTHCHLAGAQLQVGLSAVGRRAPCPAQISSSNCSTGLTAMYATGTYDTRSTSCYPYS